MAATLAAFALVTSSAAAATLTGAGSTLVAPLANIWVARFMAATPGSSVTYQGVGSGAGIADIGSGRVDFGATDAPITFADGVQCKACALVPWALTATGVGYDVSGVGKGLKLSGNVLAGIYLGKIKNWDNPQIAALNKGLQLPNLKITPVFRSDTSGDSYAFSGFLGAVSTSWKSRNGGSTISFPESVGIGEAGNGGVAGAISSVKGSIGYMSVSYLISHNIDVARIANAKGNYEFPNLPNIAAAAAGVKSVPTDNVLRIVDPPSTYSTAYPISTFTYALVHKGGNANSELLKRWLTYCLTSGRADGVTLGFAPLPKLVQTAALRTISSIS